MSHGSNTAPHNKPDPRTFTDLEGDSWTVRVTYGDIQDVEQQCGVNLIELFDEDLKNLASLVDDLPKLVSVAACLCSSQMEKRGITPAQFASRMGGDTLEQVTQAVIEATIDFFPRANRREALRGAWVRVNKISNIALEALPAKAFAEMDALTEEDWLTKLNGLSGRVQASPD